LSERLGTRLARRAAGFLRELWVYVLLAVLLTTIIGAVRQLGDPAALSALFVGNLVLSCSIGASCELAAVLALGAGSERTPRSLAPLRVVPVMALAVWVGVGLGLAAVGVLFAGSERLFPPRAVLLISVPTSLLMAGVAVLRDRAQREQAQRREVEHALEGARLAALSARTDPHFLFNSLNGIAALIPEDPERAERAVLALAALFRYVLEGAGSELVPLADELAFVRAYLALESLRFGERLAVSIEIATEAADARVPPLALQPLVENAVRHGLSTGAARLALEVRAEREGDALLLVVDDDGPGPGGSRHHGAGTSHAHLGERLALAYGGAARFETGRSPRGGFRAKLTLPRCR